VFFNMISKFCH